MNKRLPGIFLLAAVFVIAVCGLVYELIAAAASSYLLGGSVTQFSIVIGVFLSAMGLGSYLTRFVSRRLPEAFIAIQIGIGLSGGLSAAVLLATFAVLATYLPVLVAVLTVTGILVGMEIPLLIRILKNRSALRLTVSNVLALDYLGALLASCAFPLFFVPYVGLLRTSFLFGLINVAVAGVGIRVLSPMLRNRKQLAALAGVVAAILGIGLAGSGVFSSMMEDLIYQDDIILARQTPYQRIIVTKWHDDVRLYLDGNLQFSSVDEYRYHESMAHPAVAATPNAVRALILGGGDGMLARELLKYPHIQRIDLVDLDGEMIHLFREHELLSPLCAGALSNPKVTVHVEDAGKFLEKSSDAWDLIFVDLPDPNNLSLGRLYTTSTFRLLSRSLAERGVVVTQATSPFYAPEAFWCIVATWGQVPSAPNADRHFNVYPYHVYVPSFGDWGFVMASRRTIDTSSLRLASIPLKFLSNEVLPSLFTFPKDTVAQTEILANHLDDQVLVKYYQKGWRRYGP